jgi:hypothetical protein
MSSTFYVTWAIVWSAAAYLYGRRLGSNQEPTDAQRDAAVARLFR